jgi:RNA polymerase sigma-70 factor (ECF subfamily)
MRPDDPNHPPSGPPTGAPLDACLAAAAPDQRLDAAIALRLLLANRGMLIGYINAITGDPTLTEDVFQEVSIVVMEKCSQVTGTDGFKPWARTIARFQSLKAVNRRKAAPLALGNDLLELMDREWDQLDREDADGEELAALRRCLGRITPRAQRLVQMRYHENLPGARIAEILGQPLNTVYVAISRIHRTLAECVRGRLLREGSSHAG